MVPEVCRCFDLERTNCVCVWVSLTERPSGSAGVPGLHGLFVSYLLVATATTS